MTNKTKILVAAAIIVLAAASRLLEHPFNFTPIIAMSLFAGCYLRRVWAVVLPLAAMLVSDFFIGFYDWQVMFSVYLGVALSFLIGRFLSARLKWYGVLFAAFSSSAIFFLVTNFAVWAFFDWYPHSLAGIASCFLAALPFFRNALLGDLVYSALFFGGYELVFYFLARRRRATLPAIK